MLMGITIRIGVKILLAAAAVSFFLTITETYPAGSQQDIDTLSPRNPRRPHKDV
jgi:hypothetical protein